MAAHLKIVVERHADGYVAYPLGLARGTVVGQGESYEFALSDVRSALAFHAEMFGPDALSAAAEPDRPTAGGLPCESQGSGYNSAHEHHH